MHRHLLALLTAAAALGLSSTLHAAPLGATAGAGQAADAVAIGEPAQYAYGGYNYCWYPGGWHGPGWYRCGFAWRRGFGWGGPVGWNGWRYGPPPPPPRVYRPGPPRGPYGPPPRPMPRGPYRP